MHILKKRIKLDRDWKAIFLVFGRLLAVIIIASPRPEGGLDLIGVFSAVCIAVNGLYGGIRGKGEKSDEEDNRNNTFGLPAGLVRGVCGGSYVICAALVGLYMMQPANGMFLLSIGLELLGLAVPGLAAGHK